MNYIFYLLFLGVLIKIVDDLNDTDIYSPKWKTVMEVLLIAVTMVAYSDRFLSCIMGVVSLFGVLYTLACPKAMIEPIWKILIIITLPTIVIFFTDALEAYKKADQHNRTLSILTILGALMLVLVFKKEDSLYPEEFSFRKLQSRFYILGLSILFAILAPMYAPSTFYDILCYGVYIIIGYFMTSIATISWQLKNSSPSLQDPFFGATSKLC